MTEREHGTRGAVLVTGTDTGIGAACVEHLSHLGFQVIAGVLNERALETARQERNTRVTSVVLDVTKSADIEAAVILANELLGDGGLAGVVNNAGFAIGGPLEYLPLDTIRRQLEVNLMGQIAITQAFLPLIRTGRGRIVNLGSPSGSQVLPFLSPYAASKAAVKAMTESLRLELRPWNIPVSLIEPGRILTDIWRQSTEDSNALLAQYPDDAIVRYQSLANALVRMNTSVAEKGLLPKHVAKVIGRALTAKRPRARYYVGTDARFLTLAAHVAPTRLRDWVIARALAHFARDSEEPSRTK